MSANFGVTRPRVVLAEDHPEMAAELRDLLMADYDVIGIAPDGWALIELVRRLMPEAIVADIGMPGVNGFAAADAILTARPDSRIVFITIHDDLAIIRKALGCGARGFVLKCDAGEELVTAVKAAISDGLYLSSNARRALGARL